MVRKAESPDTPPHAPPRDEGDVFSTALHMPLHGLDVKVALVNTEHSASPRILVCLFASATKMVFSHPLDTHLSVIRKKFDESFQYIDVERLAVSFVD